MKKRWEVKKTEINTVKKLAKDLGVSNVVAKLLTLRGINTFDEAEIFFRPKLCHLHDPFLMKNMHKAVKRLEEAITKNQKILVYGDYDVDGTTSVAMMYSFLKKYNKNVEYYIPCRYKEGYGVSLRGIDYAHENKVSLIITLDCGIRAEEQINYAKKVEIDFIICDHHTPSDELPDAIAILNPKQFDCKYPYKHLSGCGVGFKLVQAYCIKNNISFNEILQYLDLLAVSIGADIVPMTGENRVFAFYGLQQVNSKPRVGLKALMENSFKSKEINMSDLVFNIAPRINAAGRIEHAEKAVEILVEEDYEKAKFFAEAIEKNNETRKALDQSITKEALSMIDESKKSTVVFSNKWHKGVVGIVASRLIESYYKPTIVFAEHDGLLTGSARSVHEFDLYKAIVKCSHLCEKFGGHKYAAGLSVKKNNLNAFVDAFETAVSETITNDQLSPKIKVDLEININEIDKKLFRIIKQFAPFGPSNLSPVFITRKVIDNGYAKKIGVERSHLKTQIKTDNGVIDCIGFGMANDFDCINNHQEFDICYSIQENKWNGIKKLQLILRDINSAI